MGIIPLKVYYFLTGLDQLPSLAQFYFRVWLIFTSEFGRILLRSVAKATANNPCKIAWAVF